jgi:hypothetical protein
LTGGTIVAVTFEVALALSFLLGLAARLTLSNMGILSERDGARTDAITARRIQQRCRALLHVRTEEVRRKASHCGNGKGKGDKNSS